MSDHCQWNATCRRLGLVALLVGLGLAASGVDAADKKKARSTNAKRTAVGKCVSGKEMILRRVSPDRPWRIVPSKGNLYPGDLLVGMPGAMLDSDNGAVRVALLADLDQDSPFPIKEAAVRLHKSSKVDLELTLDRGRVDLLNRKKKGPATVRLRVWDQKWLLTLTEPGSEIALELYGRWPAGSKFTKKPGPKDVPTAHLIFLVRKGEVAVKHGDFEHFLTAPPGPAMMGWDSVSGHDETPHRLDKLPPWAATLKSDTLLAKAAKVILERFRKRATSKGLEVAVAEFLKSDNVLDRRLAVLVMAALDDIKGLGKAIRETKKQDVWDNGILALRHWIGRCPGQDQLLYKALLANEFDPVSAQTVVELLHSFSEEELASPELYQTLIDYLDHDVLAIRGLAYWHLRRLAPEGKKFGYHPQDSAEKRAAAVKLWQKLIPKGKVPPPPKAEEKKKERE
jgi:hypothetical protein